MLVLKRIVTYGIMSQLAFSVIDGVLRRWMVWGRGGGGQCMDDIIKQAVVLELRNFTLSIHIRTWLKGAVVI